MPLHRIAASSYLILHGLLCLLQSEHITSYLGCEAFSNTKLLHIFLGQDTATKQFLREACKT